MERNLARRIERLANVDERVLASELAESVAAIERACSSARDDRDWSKALLLHALLGRFYLLNMQALDGERSQAFRSLRRDLARRVVAALRGGVGWASGRLLNSCDGIANGRESRRPASPDWSGSTTAT